MIASVTEQHVAHLSEQLRDEWQGVRDQVEALKALWPISSPEDRWTQLHFCEQKTIMCQWTNHYLSLATRGQEASGPRTAEFSEGTFEERMRLIDERMAAIGRDYL